MNIARRSLLPGSCRESRCCPLLWICRVVIVLVVLILAVILALRGYPPEAIAGSVVVLVTGAVTAANQLASTQHGRPASPEPAP